MVLGDLLAPGEGPVEVERGPLDRCLGCLACESMCPSGVPYGQLLGAGRVVAAAAPAPDPGLERLVDEVLSRPRLFAALAAGAAVISRWIPRGLIPPPLDRWLEGLPRRRPHWPRRPATPDTGSVDVLTGCAQWVYTPEVLDATLRLIRAVGEEPVLPRGQGCCGALSHHQGSVERARALARANVDAFEGIETVIVPSAGCSAHMLHYGELLADDPFYAERAESLARRSVDLLVWLDSRGECLQLAADSRRVAYHPPCHHLHAQRIDGPAQRLLDRVPELTHAEPERRHLCCGSAGSYSMQQPAIARQRQEEKVTDLLALEPDLVLTANPGCELFIDVGLAKRGSPPRIEHLAVYLASRLAGVDET